MELRSSPRYVPPRDSNPCRLGECPNQLDYIANSGNTYHQKAPPNSASTYMCSLSTQLDLKHVLCQTQTVSNSILLQGAHGVVVSHLLRMQKALGSIPSVSMLAADRQQSITTALARVAGSTPPSHHFFSLALIFLHAPALMKCPHQASNLGCRGHSASV